MTDAERYLRTCQMLWLTDRIYVLYDEFTSRYAVTTLDLAACLQGREYFATFEALREQHGARMAEAVRKVGSDA